MTGGFGTSQSLAAKKKWNTTKGKVTIRIFSESNDHHCLVCDQCHDLRVKQKEHPVTCRCLLVDELTRGCRELLAKYVLLRQRRAVAFLSICSAHKLRCTISQERWIGNCYWYEWKIWWLNDDQELDYGYVTVKYAGPLNRPGRRNGTMVVNR